MTPAEARAFHDEICVIDLHADTPKLMDKLGYDLAERHERPMPKLVNYVGHVDIPRLHDGGVAAQFFAFWTWPTYIPGAERSNTRSVANQLDALDAAIAAHPDKLVWTRTGADIRYTYAPRETFAALGFPGAEDLADMFEYYRLHIPSRMRDIDTCRAIAPELQSFETWVARNEGKLRVTLGHVAA
jgi:membrane dipeptidase